MLYRTLELTLAPALRVVYRPEVTGAESIPREGPVILAANHISFADEIFTPLAARRQVAYFAKAEYFTTPGLKGQAMAWFFRSCGHVPVERADTRAAASVIDIGVDVLREGRALGIFPEGTRSPDGRLYKFRTGVARVALAQRGAGRSRSGWSGRARCSRPASAGGTARRWPCTSARRCTSATAPARSAAPGCCARSPTSSGSRSRNCARRSTSTPTPGPSREV